MLTSARFRVFITGIVMMTCLLPLRSAAQCSSSNPAGCSCPTPGSPNCLLLPDITAGKKTLNSSSGWTEYTQAAAAPNKGLLRIDVSTPNVGWGPLETIPTNNYLCGNDTLFNFVPPASFLCPDGSYPRRMIKQRLYQKVGNSFQYIERDAGWMIYHPSHGHIHIDGWGLYTLRLRDVTVTDTLQWPVVNSGVKVSFCLIDLTTCSGSLGDCVSPTGVVLNNLSFPNYGLGGGYGCNNIKQGISVGKVDIYSRSLDESFVRIPYEACNGSYYAVIQVDPDNHFMEMNDNNNWLAAQIPLTRQRTTNTGPYAYIFSKKGNTVCQGSNLQLEASGASSYTWSTGATTQQITITQPGKYWVRATTPCGTSTSDTLNIAQSGTSAYPSVTVSDTICAGEKARLFASGNAHWYDAPSGGNLVFIGNDYETGSLFTNTTFYVADQPSVLGGKLAPSSTTFSAAGNYTAAKSEYLIFNAFLPFKLKTLKVNASTAGVRIIQLRDQYGHLIQQKSVTLTAGIQDISLDFFVPSGLNHQLGLSGSSPLAALYTSTTTNPNIGYPYKLNSVTNIVGSSLGDNAFPFFYDWEVEVTSQACNSGQRKPVTVTVVPAPAVTVNGLLPTYNHAAAPVKLTGNPAGGTFSGTAVINDYFYPRLAGLGSHIITYSISNGVCTAEAALETRIVLDERLLYDGIFSLQLQNTPGPHPLLWVVSRDNADMEITLLNSVGQTLKTIRKAVNPGGNYINLDMERYPKGMYILNVKHTASQRIKTLKLLN